MEIDKENIKTKEAKVGEERVAPGAEFPRLEATADEEGEEAAEG